MGGANPKPSDIPALDKFPLPKGLIALIQGLFSGVPLFDKEEWELVRIFSDGDEGELDILFDFDLGIKASSEEGDPLLILFLFYFSDVLSGCPYLGGSLGASEQDDAS